MMEKKRKLTVWEREYQIVWKQEQKFLRQYEKENTGALRRKIEELAPERLRETLHAAFVKAFRVVFEKGDILISQRRGREKRRRDFLVRRYASELREDRQNLRAFHKAARSAGRGNLLLSGAAGMGMGLLGVGLPDVPVLTGMLLKTVYETAEHYGFPHDSLQERRFVLCLMEAALCGGEELREKNAALNAFMEKQTWGEVPPLDLQMQAAARRLSETVLLGKFVQGTPVIGIVGGLDDVVCLQRIRRYADVKYRRRFLIDRRLKQQGQLSVLR